MALKKAFTDSQGHDNPDAYWRPVQVNIGVADGNCHIVFYAYKDAAAKSAGNSPLSGAVHQYSISGAEFAALYAQHTAPGGPNLFEMVYSYAKTKLDVDTGQKDTHGNQVMVSFFDGATDI